MKFTAQEIASFVTGTVEGDPRKTVSNFSKIEESDVQSLTFFDHEKYLPYLYTTKAAVILIDNKTTLKKEVPNTLIRVNNTREAFTKLLNNYVATLRNQKKGIENPSFIARGVALPEGIFVGAFAYIGKGVKLGKNVKIYPHAYIDDNVKIASGTTIYAGVKIYPNTEIGENCIIHAGAVVGSDGFGYTPDEKGRFIKVPHLGKVVIEKDVEIGANTTIDRATLGATKICEGVKLDNLIQVAHNVEINKHTAMAAQSGVAGSTKVGAYCQIGGQSAIVGHLKLGDFIKCQGQSGITKSFKDGVKLQGTPAIDYNNYSRAYIHFKNLPQLEKRVRDLEKNQ